MTTEILRHLLRDIDSLKEYRAGTLPAVEDISRRAFVRERAGHLTWPDQIFRGWQQNNLGVVAGKSSVQDALLRLFQTYVDHYLMVRDGKVHVHLYLFSQWQEELSSLAPLPLVVFALERQYPAPDIRDRGALAEYIDRHCQQFRYSAIIAPFHPLVDDLIRRERLYETHIHLNGSTEVDVLWQAALHDPQALGREMKAALKGSGGAAIEREMLYELYQQVEPGLDAVEMAHRFQAAGHLRQAIVLMLRGEDWIRSWSAAALALSQLSKLPVDKDGGQTFDWKLALVQHPLRELWPSDPQSHQKTCWTAPRTCRWRPRCWPVSSVVCGNRRMNG